MEEAEQLYWKSEKKCEELKLKELTAVQVQIQLSEIQGFTDKQKSFYSLGLAKKPKILFVILRYTKVDLTTRLLKIYFRKSLWSPSWKTPVLPIQTLWGWTGDLYDPKGIREFAEKHSPGLWESLLKALTGDCGALTSEWADLQNRRIVALLHILAYFR